MTDRTADEALSQNIASMGEPLGTFYSALWQELALVYGKWNEFKALFGTDQSCVDLLNEAAPQFFRIVQDVLWEDVLLGVARLTDPPNSLKNKKKSNLTFFALADLVQDAALSKSLRSRLKAAESSTGFCRDWRNRRIAHRDLNLVLRPDAEPLQPASRALVREALSCLAAMLNEVSSHYLHSTSSLDLPYNIGGAACLLEVLKDGLIRQQEREARISRGDFYCEVDLTDER